MITRRQAITGITSIATAIALPTYKLRADEPQIKGRYRGNGFEIVSMYNGEYKTWIFFGYKDDVSAEIPVMNHLCTQEWLMSKGGHVAYEYELRDRILAGEFDNTRSSWLPEHWRMATEWARTESNTLRHNYLKHGII